ncbi:hypothetical protein OPU71_06520 [Niveibacterium sp. 24ML]|uniref:hypothetical protein n=1 Tax=Niveibacterium sp. 24ML TaxID=2985512 RepID=UPI00227040B7|nr:hypothetical protein [Niveibacterium sp. 24ML]MCX9155779.1 hypothetical protein [Niveibacterium sp. 24ML]
MTRPTESADDRDLHEVQDAYRALPPAEPGAALDARVRAAVAAELARATPADAEAPRATAKVIAFPWWRRASLPLAAAATLMVAVGLGRMWFVDGLADRAPDSAYEPAPVAVQEAPAPAPEAATAALDAAPAESRAAPVLPQTAKPTQSVAKAITEAPPAPKSAPQKADTRTEEDAVVFRGLERAAPPPPPAEAEAKAEAKPESTKQADSARLERSAESLNAAPAMAAPAPVQAAKPAASEVPAAKAMQKRAISADMAAPLDTETFDEVRRLLRDQRPDEARALLKRWREAHPGATLPEDLRALAAELDRAP